VTITLNIIQTKYTVYYTK